MLPSKVILDPYLTVPLPPSLTAFTGMDALAHCLEAYSSEIFHPLITRYCSRRNENNQRQSC